MSLKYLVIAAAALSAVACSKPEDKPVETIAPTATEATAPAASEAAAPATTEATPVSGEAAAPAEQPKEETQPQQ